MSTATDWADPKSPATTIAFIKQALAALKTPQLIFSPMVPPNMVYTFEANALEDGEPKKLALNPKWVDFLRENGDQLDVEIIFPEESA